MDERRITIQKLDHAGRPAVTYHGEIVRQEADLVVVRCPWSRDETVDVGLFAMAPGDVFDEYYYRGEWFNVFEVRDGEGRLKGWYCNLMEPPEITDGGRTIRWRDLALDLVVLPDGTYELADIDEFEALCPSEELRRRAAEVQATLLAWVESGRGPFGST